MVDKEEAHPAMLHVVVPSPRTIWEDLKTYGEAENSDDEAGIESSEDSVMSHDSGAMDCIKKGEVATNTVEAGANEEKNDHSPHAVIEKWSNDATIHGIHYALNRERLLPWRRALWGLLLLFSTSLMIWQIGVLIAEYRKYETNTNAEIMSPDGLSFPEVTICNLNPFQESLVLETGIQGDPVDEEELRAISQTRKEFLIATSYNRVEKNASEAWTPVITNYGLCFQFRTDEYITRPGLEGGLSVSLYVNPANYYNGTNLRQGVGFGVGYGVGVRVFVAQKGATKVSQMPFDLALPGALQFISMSRQIVKREESFPWSRCHNEAPFHTQPKCREECFAFLVREVCNCREYGDTKDPSMPFCPDSQECYRQIAETERGNDCDGAVSCTRPPCKEEVYTTRSSAMGLTLAEDGFFDISQFLTLLINYESIREEVITEAKRNSFSQLLGNIGGQMGLFMGVSVISIIEIFGELLPLRLLPRVWGDKRLYGMGSKER